MEEARYDPDSGQLLSASFMDYAVPRATDLPRFDVVMREVPTQANPLGVKGAGQAGCIGAPQTIVAAILDALRPLGVTHIDMPATPARIWRAISQVQALKSERALKLLDGVEHRIASRLTASRRGGQGISGCEEPLASSLRPNPVWRLPMCFPVPVLA